MEEGGLESGRLLEARSGGRISRDLGGRSKVCRMGNEEFLKGGGLHCEYCTYMRNVGKAEGRGDIWLRRRRRGAEGDQAMR